MFRDQDGFGAYAKLFKHAIVLNNGHAAMMGMFGIIVHEEITPLGYDPKLPIIVHLD